MCLTVCFIYLFMCFVCLFVLFVCLCCFVVLWVSAVFFMYLFCCVLCYCCICLCCVCCVLCLVFLAVVLLVVVLFFCCCFVAFVTVFVSPHGLFGFVCVLFTPFCCFFSPQAVEGEVARSIPPTPPISPGRARGAPGRRARPRAAGRRSVFVN